MTELPRVVRPEDLGLPRERAVNARGVLGALGTLAVLAVVVVLVGSVLTVRDVEPGYALAVGERDGREVVVVPSEHGAGASFVAAYDTTTGERLWRHRTGYRPWPLAAGTEHVILRDDDQLVVLDLADGSVVAEGDAVPGLDLPHGELNFWVGGDAVDPVEGVVYVSVHDGFPEERPDLVRALPVDGPPTAAPLTGRQAERWSCYVATADAGRPDGAPVVDGVVREGAAGVVVPDVCDRDPARAVDDELAPGSGVVATMTPERGAYGRSELVLTTADGAALHRVDDVSDVAAARTTPSGGAVLLVRTQLSALFGLTTRYDAVLVLVSPGGEVTEVGL
ncbi:hypothetical protein ACFQBY_00310 [Promicromonospora citrea]|uniref:Uncharacterized protein n=2 Tax=Promicromonospora citrea TaxID=43677 RepID=A0A8H9GLZ2_9MICO|nr:hypothetical protein [Promicromonospora citrea]NNH54300.1 hypothetical protein [Promicromonospora citrea]GGM38161.1 hypothetical protein GCM10010102_37140 [Promicromonospora citrea]